MKRKEDLVMENTGSGRTRGTYAAEILCWAAFAAAVALFAWYGWKGLFLIVDYSGMTYGRIVVFPFVYFLIFDVFAPLAGAVLFATVAVRQREVRGYRLLGWIRNAVTLLLLYFVLQTFLMWGFPQIV